MLKKSTEKNPKEKKVCEKKVKEKVVKQKKPLKLPAINLKSLKESMKGTKESKRSIMQTLLVGFLVPVVMMIILGTVCYNMASSGILTKYKESAMSTVTAVGNYCNLVCDSISSKALELITNSDVGDYYDKYYKCNCY